MKCSICGVKLKKDGEICSNCYKELQEDEEYKNDVNEVYKIKRKYSINYEMLRYTGIILIFVMCFTIFLITRSFGEFFISLAIAALVFGVLLFLDKRIANATTVTFYEKKAVYRFKFLFFNKVKEVKYKDIKDVSIYQTFRQKTLKMGDLCFYAKGLIPGASLLNGFQIKDIENVVEVRTKIKEIIGTIKK